MKKFIFFAVLIFLVKNINAQPGKYAGTKKSLIGKEYTILDSLKALKGWKFIEGSVMNTFPLSEPELHIVDVYKKSTTCIILFSIKDTATEKSVITDVVEVTGVLKDWTIRTVNCSQNDHFDTYIAAWAKETTNAYMSIKKAWKYNPDKRRVIQIPIKGIKCENIGS